MITVLGVLRSLNRFFEEVDFRNAAVSNGKKLSGVACLAISSEFEPLIWSAMSVKGF